MSDKTPQEQAADLLEFTTLAQLAEQAEAEAEATTTDEPAAAESTEGEQTTEAAEGAAAETAEGEPEKTEPEAPWTKERIAEESSKLTEERAAFEAERTKLADEQREFNLKRNELVKRASGIDARQQRLRADVAKHKQEKQQFSAEREWVITNLRALRTGDGETRLRALGALTGEDPQKAYENLSLGIASNGKGTESDDVRALREELKREREETRRQQQEAERRAQQEAQAKQYTERRRLFGENAVEIAKTSLEQHPAAARVAAGNPKLFAAQAVQSAELFYQQKGRPIDMPTLLGMLDQEFRPFTDLSQQATGTETGEKGTATSGVDAKREIAAQAAQPAAAQRTPKGQSIPQNVGASGNRRPANETERRREAARLIPDEWISFAEE